MLGKAKVTSECSVQPAAIVALIKLYQQKEKLPNIIVNMFVC